MTPTAQVVIDCENPHLLASFWATALEVEVEDHHDQINRLLEEGRFEISDDVIEVDGRLKWRSAAACSDPAEKLPRVLCQVVPEPKTVKNRVHLDIRVEDGQRQAKVEQLEQIGAVRLWDGQQGPFSWVTMADPEGNEFCLT